MKKRRFRLLPKMPAMSVALGLFLLLGGALVGWLAGQDPAPDPLPYVISLPVETPAVSGGAEAAPSPEPDPAITMTPVESATNDAEDTGATDQAEPAAQPAPVANAGIATATALPLSSIGLGERASSMQPAPHPALVEQGRYGLVPIISADGREAWQVYARPFNDTDPRPLVALVFAELGMSRAKTHQVLQLPGAVTMAFSPYAEGLEDWVREARAAGHEVLLEVPMEPHGYPSNDPGPRALLTSLGPSQNLDRLNWLLGRFPGYVGIMEGMGGRFATSLPHMETVLDAVKRRGLLYVDRRRGASSVSIEIAQQIGLLNIGVEIDIDADPSPREIARRLTAAENRVQRTGTVVLVARPYPVTISAVREWIATFEEKSITLAPLTAVAARQARDG